MKLKKYSLIMLLMLPQLFSQSVEIYVPDVDGTEYNGQSVKLWLDNIYIGEKQTVNSLAVFDSVTSAETLNPVSVSVGAYLENETINYGVSAGGKVELIITDILGRHKKLNLGSKQRGTERIYLNQLGIRQWSSGYYGVIIKTASEVHYLGLMKVENRFTGTKSKTEVIKGVKLKKPAAAQLKIEVTHPDHYKRTIRVEQSSRIDDYVVGYVNQMKLDSTMVTPEEFKQYCFDFNFDGASNMPAGLKSFFPNENKEIWIARSDKNDPSMTYTTAQMESIRDFVTEDIFPYINAENQPTFYLQPSVNPDEIPMFEIGKIVIMPSAAGFGFGTSGDPQTNVILSGRSYLSQNLIPGSDNARSGTLEEVASCFMAPSGGQGSPYGHGGIQTVFVNEAIMTPVDIKLFQMGQKIPTKTQIDDVLGL